MNMPEPLKKLRLSPQRVRPLIWLFPIACSLAGSFSVGQQYQREARLHGELAKAQRQLKELGATTDRHEH